MKLDNVFLAWGYGFHIAPHHTCYLLIVDVNICKVGIEKITENRGCFIYLSQNALRSPCRPYVFVHFLPSLHKIMKILIQLCYFGAFGLSAYDNSHVRWAYAMHQLAKPVAFCLIDD